MANSDFDFKNILNTVRSTINPEYAIPKDKEKHPVNFRISRIKNLIGELHKAQQMLSAELNRMDAQISGLIEEVQPYLNDEKKVSEADIKEAEKEDGTSTASATPVKAEGETPEASKTEESTSEETKSEEADSKPTEEKGDSPAADASSSEEKKEG